MLYYLGKGTKLKKEECKEYKTIEGALRAAAKDEALVVWDENGQVIGSLTDNVPAFDADGKTVGVVDAETVAEVTGNAPQDDADGQQDGEKGDEQGNEQPTQENAQNEANSASDEENEVIVPQGKMKVTVICDGSLNLRRSPAWGNENICGRATRGQSYFVKEIHKVNGKKMVRTVGDVYLSGESEHVQFEQV